MKLSFSRLFYNLSLAGYRLGIGIASVFNNKAGKFVRGRKGIFEQLQKFRTGIGNKKLIWMHCASLGEFEQGRPVLEELRKRNPDKAFILTFFSPSGYEIRKNYAGADGVFYLPTDSQAHAEKFIAVLKPSLAIWVKYEYWYHYLHQLNKHKIPVLLISAIFREHQPFFKSYGKLWVEMLHFFNIIFTQNEESVRMLRELGIRKAQVAGDTRFDRVVEIAATNNKLPDEILNFVGTSPVLVAGSTWEEDIMMLKHFVQQNRHIKFVIAPHEVDEKTIQTIKKHIVDVSILSELKNNSQDYNVIVINKIGLLSSLYKIADVTYVGGGFNTSGIHNTLEAAVYGKPVVFGPNYEKFDEAVGLVNNGAAFSFQIPTQLETILTQLFSDDQKRILAGNKAGEFVQKNTGATAKIVNEIYAMNLLG